MACRIKKGDRVVILAGAYKTNEPHEVLHVDDVAGKVLVQGVNMRWKHVRRSPQNPDGGRLQREAPLDISNVQLFSDKAGKGVRTRVQTIDGKKSRIGVQCGTNFDA